MTEPEEIEDAPAPPPGSTVRCVMCGEPSPYYTCVHCAIEIDDGITDVLTGEAEERRLDAALRRRRGYRR